jgi:Fe-S cluster assembly ATP-binding protein
MLELKQITIQKDKKILVSTASAVFSSGEIIIIEGENGSGKSSLFSGIFGYNGYSVSSGKILLEEVFIQDKTLAEKTSLPLFYSPQNIPTLEGVSLISFLYAFYKKQENKNTLSIVQFKKELEEKISVLGFRKEILERRFGKDFSGGEKKQVEIIQLLISNAQYFFLDEVDAGLDTSKIEKLAELLINLKAQGRCIVLITHNSLLRDVLSPTRVYKMQEKTLVEKIM